MSLAIDVASMVDFLVGLLNIPSPTGDTDNAMHYVKEAFASFPFSLHMSRKGYLAGTWQVAAADPAPRAVTAHTDTLGAMVQRIQRNGRLLITQLGGWVWNSVEGEGVTIFASSGTVYRGSILPTAASIHAHARDQLEAKRNATNMEVRIDAHTASAHETRELGIEVGDIIAFDPRVEVSDNGFIRARHLDDKAGVAVIYGALKALTAANLAPAQTTTFHISNYEEVGHGAATGFPQNLAELLTIDMAVVAPDQTSDEYSVTICAKDAAGPYHLGMRRRLEQLAKANSIRYQTDIYPHYGSDGEAFWRAGGDVAVGLIGPGVDASHHYERTHQDALEQSARLLAAYLLE